MQHSSPINHLFIIEKDSPVYPITLYCFRREQSICSQVYLKTNYESTPHPAVHQILYKLTLHVVSDKSSVYVSHR